MCNFRNARELNVAVENALNEMYDDMTNKVCQLVDESSIEEVAEILGASPNMILDIVNGELADNSVISAEFVTKVLAMFGMTLCIMPMNGMPNMPMGGMPMNGQVPFGGMPMPNRRFGGRRNMPMQEAPRGQMNEGRRRNNHRPNFGGMPMNGQAPFGGMPMPNMPMDDMPMPSHVDVPQPMPNMSRERMNDGMIGDMPLPYKVRNNNENGADIAVREDIAVEADSLDISSQILDAISSNPNLKESLKQILNS